MYEKKYEKEAATEWELQFFGRFLQEILKGSETTIPRKLWSSFSLFLYINPRKCSPQKAIRVFGSVGLLAAAPKILLGPLSKLASQTLQTAPPPGDPRY